MKEKEHWENVFTTKAENEVSWYQKIPTTSLTLIENLQLSKDAKIIDVGGGDSYLIDSLLEKGYTNLFLLDISEHAIERAKKRLGEKACKVTFIVSKNIALDIDEKFELWHDRASFHFLTAKVDIELYSKVVSKYVTDNGQVVIGTFSEKGPKKCSGLEITQYTAETMRKVFENDFELVSSFEEDHQTPFDTTQNFIFCTFNKK
ncbi:class I SAM-dependent methyltransferase [Flavobacterium sp.]|uniref:class I SAM-dependent methyltransferase n=1 Tax=Flavobacterium sp. TaxID=239 RepID=UPI003D14B296